MSTTFHFSENGLHYFLISSSQFSEYKCLIRNLDINLDKKSMHVFLIIAKLQANLESSF